MKPKITTTKLPKKTDSENYGKLISQIAELDNALIDTEMIRFFTEETLFNDEDNFDGNVGLLTKLLGDYVTEGFKRTYTPGQKRNKLSKDQIYNKHIQSLLNSGIDTMLLIEERGPGGSSSTSFKCFKKLLTPKLSPLFFV